MNTNYQGKGIDQLTNLIDMIKKTPYSRRLILTSWNPMDLSEMALPPCHILAQFYVANNELSCQLNQRSADMGLGIPFNIASYALLTRMIAQVCNLEVGEFIHVLGDAHIYLNHIDQLQEQLNRSPRDFPLLQIDPSIKNIDDFKSDHFKLEHYYPYPKIDMKMNP